jgi:hypothetical protein
MLAAVSDVFEAASLAVEADGEAGATGNRHWCLSVCLPVYLSVCLSVTGKGAGSLKCAAHPLAHLLPTSVAGSARPVTAVTAVTCSQPQDSPDPEVDLLRL